jgi:hypothetical protein
MPEPATLCLAPKRVAVRIVIRPSWPRACTPDHIHWPLLVVQPCPYSPSYEVPHSHTHVMTTPGPWLRHAPCNRKPYLLEPGT